MNSLTQGFSIVVYDFSALKGKHALKHDTILMQRNITDFEVHYMQNMIGKQDVRIGYKFRSKMCST